MARKKRVDIVVAVAGDHPDAGHARLEQLGARFVVVGLQLEHARRGRRAGRGNLGLILLRRRGGGLERRGFRLRVWLGRFWGGPERKCPQGILPFVALDLDEVLAGQQHHVVEPHPAFARQRLLLDAAAVVDGDLEVALTERLQPPQLRLAFGGEAVEVIVLWAQLAANRQLVGERRGDQQCVVGFYFEALTRCGASGLEAQLVALSRGADLEAVAALGQHQIAEGSAGAAATLKLVALGVEEDDGEVVAALHQNIEGTAGLSGHDVEHEEVLVGAGSGQRPVEGDDVGIVPATVGFDLIAVRQQALRDGRQRVWGTGTAAQDRERVRTLGQTQTGKHQPASCGRFLDDPIAGGAGQLQLQLATDRALQLELPAALGVLLGNDPRPGPILQQCAEQGEGAPYLFERVALAAAAPQLGTRGEPNHILALAAARGGAQDVRSGRDQKGLAGVETAVGGAEAEQSVGGCYVDAVVGEGDAEDIGYGELIGDAFDLHHPQLLRGLFVDGPHEGILIAATQVAHGAGQRAQGVGGGGGVVGFEFREAILGEGSSSEEHRQGDNETGHVTPHGEDRGGKGGAPRRKGASVVFGLSLGHLER